jgi:hypothetical protein
MKYKNLLNKHGFANMADAKRCKDIIRLKALLKDIIEQEKAELSVFFLKRTGNQIN